MNFFSFCQVLFCPVKLNKINKYKGTKKKGNASRQQGSEEKVKSEQGSKETMWGGERVGEDERDGNFCFSPSQCFYSGSSV